MFENLSLVVLVVNLFKAENDMFLVNLSENYFIFK